MRNTKNKKSEFKKKLGAGLLVASGTTLGLTGFTHGITLIVLFVLGLIIYLIGIATDGRREKTNIVHQSEDAFFDFEDLIKLLTIPTTVAIFTFLLKTYISPFIMQLAYSIYKYFI